MELSNVNTYLGLKNKPGDIGLELECEAKKELPIISDVNWISKPEGSLRGYAIEYVSKGPLKVDGDLYRKISSLCEKISDKKYGLDSNSPRTSLHVHSNVGDFSLNEYWTLVTAYWLCENLLIKHCGESREGNLFCLRLKDAEGVLNFCTNDLKQKKPFTKLNNNHIRYASQNLNATPKFGSIEYRGMRGITDAESIFLWANEIHNLSKNARKYRTPADLMDRFATLPKRDFLLSLFSSAFVDKLTDIPGWRGLLDDNVGALCELAYFHDDWGKWQNKMESNRNKVNSLVPLDVPLTEEQIQIAKNNKYKIRYNIHGDSYVRSIMNKDGEIQPEKLLSTVPYGINANIVNDLTTWTIVNG